MYYKGEITHQEYEDETGETLLQQQVLYPAVNKMNIPPKGFRCVPPCFGIYAQSITAVFPCAKCPMYGTHNFVNKAL